MIIENNIFTTIILTSYLSVLGSVSGVVLCIVLLCIFIYQTIVPLPGDNSIHTVQTSIHYLYNADILAQVSSLGLLRYLLTIIFNTVPFLSLSPGLSLLKISSEGRFISIYKTFSKFTPKNLKNGRAFFQKMPDF